MNRTHRSIPGRLLLLPILAAILLAACGNGPTGSPGPSGPPPSPSPSLPSPPITTPEAAAALALAADPRFAGIKPPDPNLIGTCCSYTVTPRGEDFEVTIEVGWGDCEAGCISRHRWIYLVTKAGLVTLQREDGPPVPAGVPPIAGVGVVGIRGIASAGPTCPVVTDKDPTCGERPVVGATVRIALPDGREVARAVTDATGAFVVALPPGRYRVQAEPVQGLMGTPAPDEVTVEAGLAEVLLSYDTGIR